MLVIDRVSSAFVLFRGKCYWANAITLRVPSCSNITGNQRSFNPIYVVFRQRLTLSIINCSYP